MKTIKKVPFKMFNQTRMVPHRTFTNTEEDFPPKDHWDDVLWVERGEDWYALDYYKGKKQTVLLVERSDWLRSYLADKCIHCGRQKLFETMSEVVCQNCQKAQ